MYGRPLYVRRKRLDVSRYWLSSEYVRKSNQSKTRTKELCWAFGRRRRERLKLNGFTCSCATEMPSERERKTKQNKWTEDNEIEIECVFSIFICRLNICVNYEKNRIENNANDGLSLVDYWWR